jgi:acid phosphatase
MKNRRGVLAALLLAFILTGCGSFSLRGLRYEFTRFKSYRPGTVLDAPAGPVRFDLPKEEAGPALEFLAVGDAGAGDRAQKIVAGAMAAAAAERPIAFVLYLGDNFYPRGVRSVKDKGWKKKFEEIFSRESLDLPFYSVLGNHDYFQNAQAQVDYTAVSRRWKMPARYYVFTEKIDAETAVDFFALDTEVLAQGRGKEELAWLERRLATSRARWKIVFGHHTVYSGGLKWRKQTEKMRGLLEPLFVKYGVTLYLCGHSHNLQAIGPVSGVHYIVDGAGARPRNVRWTEQTRFAFADLGFVRFRATPRTLDVFFLNGGGTVIYAYRIP